ncbi:MAG TPA: RHS repeat protein, partial [Ghiorsea sp.]|nr:RHS repeat protein [Ghiorsea sp.]
MPFIRKSLQTFLAGVLLSISFTSHAGCGPDGGGGGGCNADADAGSAQQSARPANAVGNPISVITGNKFQFESDYNAVGSYLMLNRQYNSANHFRDQGMGAGWLHSYEVKLYRPDNNEIQVVQSDGRRIVFTLESADSGLYRAVSPQDGTISLIGDLQQDKAKQSYRWDLSDGRQMSFTHQWLTKISYPGKRFLNLRYKNNHLAKVQDHQGRSLLFHYSTGATGLASFDQEAAGTTAGHLTSVTLPDNSVIQYSYDDALNLTKVSYSDDSTRLYHYENIAFPNHLTGITDRTGKRFASWRYDEQGRAITSEHANGVEKVSLQYKLPEREDQLGTTTVTNSLGQKSTYTWKHYNHNAQALLFSSEGPGCSTCPAPNKTYTYTPHYQIETTTDTLTGDITRYSYDDQGRTLSITKRANGGGVPLETLIARYEYEGNQTRPSIIARPSVNAKGEHITQITYNEDQLPISLTEKGFSPETLLTTPDSIDTANTSYIAIERTTKLSYTNGNLTTIDGPRDDVQDLIQL